MNAAELTRLRVAQAARTPVSVEQIVKLLAADSAAENAGVRRVQGLVDDWVAAGILRARGDDPVVYSHATVFEDEIARRVCAHCLRPRTLTSLEREIAKDDQLPNLREHSTLVEEGELVESELQRIVRELVADGLLVEIETPGTLEPDEGEPVRGDSVGLADAVDGHEDAIDLHPSSRALLIERLALPARSWEFESGHFYVLSRKGLDALQVT